MSKISRARVIVLGVVIMGLLLSAVYIKSAGYRLVAVHAISEFGIHEPRAGMKARFYYYELQADGTRHSIDLDVKDPSVVECSWDASKQRYAITLRVSAADAKVLDRVRGNDTLCVAPHPTGKVDTWLEGVIKRIHVALSSL